MDNKLNNLLEDLKTYKNRLSVALKIADISIFEVDLQKQLFTYIDNSEGIFEKKSSDILSEVNAFQTLPWDQYVQTVSAYLMHPEDAHIMEAAFHSLKNGSSISFEARFKDNDPNTNKWCKVNLAPVENDGTTQKMIAIISDIQHIKNRITLLENSIYTDHFTGLYSKKRFEELCNSVLADRKDSKCIMMVIDLDYFKSVNDTHGHMAGDEVLLSFSQHLSSSVRKKDIVARFGGDEFVLLLLDVTDIEIGKKKAEEILRLQDNSYGVTKSIGISLYPDMGTTYDELFRKADKALYKAKQKRNAYCVYGEE
ncbi:MAG: GGDEF domain-containing protein [Anaerotignum sp.]|nr:GGDEF domain-containing protein [Anaerotignum sp.]